MDVNITMLSEYKRLMSCFPGSFINYRGEFIAHKVSNTYFDLFSCKDELEIKCKVLAYLSRAASKGQPYRADKNNAAFRQLMLKGMNKYLGTSFTHEEMDEIYTYLGGGINLKKTRRFIQSGYDRTILSQKPLCGDMESEHA